MHHPVVIPNVRAVVRHSAPKVIEGKLVPLLLFVTFLEVFGNVWALMIALTWSLGTIAIRLATGRRVPGLIVLSAAALTGKTIAALVTGSMLVYFLQPTITTVIVGITFLVSVPLGNPLAQKLACDVFPFEDDTRSHPLMQQFFVRLSVLWSFTSLVNASITVWLLLTQSHHFRSHQIRARAGHGDRDCDVDVPVASIGSGAKRDTAGLGPRLISQSDLCCLWFVA